MHDYHIHLENGPMTIDWLRKFIYQAQMRGINDIGISEHTHYFIELKFLYYQKIDVSDSLQGKRQRQLMADSYSKSLTQYFDLLARARAHGMPVKFGLELDWFPGNKELTQELLEQWPLDYIIGSVHWLDGWCYDIWSDAWKGRNILATWEQYLDHCIDGVSSGTFDILGHADSIKIFGHYPAYSPEEKWEELAATLAASGVTVEINTKLHYRGRSSYFCPDPHVLKLFRNHGVEICFGSDAHYPEDAGLMIDKAIEYAKVAGYTHCNTFSNREKQRTPLP